MTAKQTRFVEEYLVDLCAAGAARRAGYSERTARTIGAENLTKPDIAAAIGAGHRAAAKRAAALPPYPTERAPLNRISVPGGRGSRGG